MIKIKAIWLKMICTKGDIKETLHQKANGKLQKFFGGRRFLYPPKDSSLLIYHGFDKKKRKTNTFLSQMDEKQSKQKKANNILWDTSSKNTS